MPERDEDQVPVVQDKPIQLASDLASDLGGEFPELLAYVRVGVGLGTGRSTRAP